MKYENKTKVDEICAEITKINEAVSGIRQFGNRVFICGDNDYVKDRKYLSDADFGIVTRLYVTSVIEIYEQQLANLHSQLKEL